MIQPVETIRLGIIGCGKVTTQRHIPSVASVSDPHVQLTAVADLAPGLAARTADRFGVPHAFADYRQLLADEAVNAVSICTPTATHAQIAIDALRAGKHVYLEKPAASNEAEMRGILAAARAGGNVFIVGSNGLLQPQMLLFKQLIDSRELGEVFHVSVSRASGRDKHDKQRRSFSSDGGINMESASHNVEWALFFLGDPKPVAATCVGYYKYDNLSVSPDSRESGETFDSCMALVQFDNGSSFMWQAMRSAVAPDKYELNIQGDQGSIHYDVHKCYKLKSDDCIRIYRQPEHGVMTETRPLMITGKTHAAMYEHFFDCIRESRPSPISGGERSVVVMRVLDALKASMAAGGRQILLEAAP